MKTTGEIASLLAKSGASRVETEYAQGEPSAMIFTICHNQQELSFRLPVRISSIFVYLQKKRQPANRTRYAKNDHEQANRVAWRQILRWVQAQFALIKTGMVRAEEVFLPYAIMPTGKTVFETLENGNYKAIAG